MPHSILRGLKKHRPLHSSLTAFQLALIEALHSLKYYARVPQVEEMAEIVYAEFARRHMLRAVSLALQLSMIVAPVSSPSTPISTPRDGRAPTSASAWRRRPSKDEPEVTGTGGTANIGASLIDGVKPDAQHASPIALRHLVSNREKEMAALRIQVRWLHWKARRMLRSDEGSSPIEELVPGLYDAFWRQKRDAGGRAKAGAAGTKARGEGSVRRGRKDSKEGKDWRRSEEGKDSSQTARSLSPVLTRLFRPLSRTADAAPGAAHGLAHGMDSGTPRGAEDASHRPPSAEGGESLQEGTSVGTRLAAMQAQLDRLIQTEEERSEKLTRAVEMAVAKAMTSRGSSPSRR